MPLLKPHEKKFAQAVSRLVACNHFLPERLTYERAALGDEFVEESAPVWSATLDPEHDRPNVLKLQQRIEELVGRLRARLLARSAAGPEELALYEDLVLHLLYYRCFARFSAVAGSREPDVGTLQTVRPSPVVASRRLSARQRIDFYPEFAREVEYYLQLPQIELPGHYQAPHLLAMFFQIRRAFHSIISGIVGRSLPIAQLRAAVWESIFTHDIRRFRRGLYLHMEDMTTLVTGASGTGKELVARAIAYARFIPFDPKRQCFTEDFAQAFHPLNLSALSPTLIESELFGHRRGAFTGAIEDRVGYLEQCSALGTVFLDEIGELDGQIQVKLLRVLQDRTFQRLGDTAVRSFSGKIIAATHRDLAAQIRAGRFREDFYYRLCSDLVTTPTLREQLQGPNGAEELAHLVGFVAQRVAGDEAVTLVPEVLGYIAQHLPANYAWPGNFRELEQCVRNILIRKEYRLPARAADVSPMGELAGRMQDGQITAEEVLSRYCRWVYQQTGTYEETAQRVGLDRRTVKAKVFEKADGANRN